MEGVLGVLTKLCAAAEGRDRTLDEAKEEVLGWDPEKKLTVLEIGSAAATGGEKGTQPHGSHAKTGGGNTKPRTAAKMRPTNYTSSSKVFE